MPIDFVIRSDTRAEFIFKGGLDDAEFEDAHAKWLSFVQDADAGGRQVELLVDGTHSEGLTAGQRRYSAAFTKEHEALLRRVCRGQAVVIVSAIQRGVMTAIFWLAPSPVPIKAFGTRAEAEAHLDGLAPRAGRHIA